MLAQVRQHVVVGAEVVYLPGQLFDGMVEEVADEVEAFAPEHHVLAESLGVERVAEEGDAAEVAATCADVTDDLTEQPSVGEHGKRRQDVEWDEVGGEEDDAVERPEDEEGQQDEVGLVVEYPPEDVVGTDEPVVEECARLQVADGIGESGDDHEAQVAWLDVPRGEVPVDVAEEEHDGDEDHQFVEQDGEAYGSVGIVLCKCVSCHEGLCLQWWLRGRGAA